MVDNNNCNLHCYTIYTEREVGTKELPLITQLKWKPQLAYQFELRKTQHQLNVNILIECK